MLSQMVPFRAVRPAWFCHWRALHAEGEHCMSMISYADVAHRIRLSTTLGDIDRCMAELRKRVVKRALTDNTLRFAIPGSVCAWRFPAAHLKLQLRLDANGRRT